MIPRFIEFCLHWRWTLFLTGVATAVLAFLLTGPVEFDQSLVSMFPRNDPVRESFGLLRRTFGDDEVVLAVYRDPHLLTDQGIGRLEELTRQLSSLSGVSDAISLASVPLARPLLTASSPARANLLNLLEGLLIGSDHQTAAVVVKLASSEEEADSQTTVANIRRVVLDHDPDGTIAGEPALVMEGYRLLKRDGKVLTSTAICLLLLVVAVCFQSVRWMLVPATVVAWTILIHRAFLQACDFEISMVSSMLTAMITVLTVATVMHAIVRFRGYVEMGDTVDVAFRRTVDLLYAPILWAIGTDIVAFSSLTVTEVGPVRDYGWMMALAAGLIPVGMVLFLPVLLVAWQSGDTCRTAWTPGKLRRALRRSALFVYRHRPLLTGLAGLILVFAVMGSLRLEVESDFTKNFRRHSEIVHSYQQIEEHLGGAGMWDVLIPFTPPLSDSLIEKLRHLAADLREVEIDEDESTVRLSKVFTIADVLDAFSSLPGGGWSSWLPVGAKLGLLRTQSPRLVESLLHIPATPGEDAYARIMLRAREQQSLPAKKGLRHEVERIVESHFPQARITGLYVLLSSLIDTILRDQWRALGIAGIGMTVMLVCAFRSPWLALIGLVPNAVPLLFVTGVMGWLGVKVNLGIAMIATVSIGLSVDSTIHYIHAFRRAVRQGESLVSAAVGAHETAGRALTYSTLCLVMGFSALITSEFMPTVYFGATVGLTMLGGLVGNLILLPLMLTTLPRRMVG